MKGETAIEHGARTVKLTLVLECMEDGGRAMELIRNATRACWPDVMFNDERLDASEQEIASFPAPPQAEPAPAFRSTKKAEPPAPAARPSKPRDYKRPPKAGSLSEKALAFCRENQTSDFTRVADAFDLMDGTAAALVANLKRGGHLEGIA